MADRLILHGLKMVKSVYSFLWALQEIWANAHEMRKSL